MKTETWIIGCLTAIFLSLLLAVGWGLLVSFLWNATIPYIFGLPEITVVQGIFLSLLSSILLKSGRTYSELTGKK